MVEVDVTLPNTSHEETYRCIHMTSSFSKSTSFSPTLSPRPSVPVTELCVPDEVDAFMGPVAVVQHDDKPEDEHDGCVEAVEVDEDVVEEVPVVVDVDVPDLVIPDPLDPPKLLASFDKSSSGGSLQMPGNCEASTSPIVGASTVLDASELESPCREAPPSEPDPRADDDNAAPDLVGLRDLSLTTSPPFEEGGAKGWAVWKPMVTPSAGSHSWG